MQGDRATPASGACYWLALMCGSCWSASRLAWQGLGAWTCTWQQTYDILLLMPASFYHADVFSFGVVLWEPLTWEMPWSSTGLNPWQVRQSSGAAQL